MYRKMIALVTVAFVGLSLTACSVSTSEDVLAPETTAAVQPAEEAVTPPTVLEEVTLGPVEQSFVDTFRKAVPNDPATDQELVTEVNLTIVDFRAFMDAGGSSTEYLTQGVTKDPANAVRFNALVTGALALDQSLSQHANF